MSLENKTKIDPEDNFWIIFSNAELNILGEKESINHGRKSQLYYGGTRKQPYPYILPLDDLKKVREFKSIPDYKELNEFTEARKTLDGKLAIRRKNSCCCHGCHNTALLSWNEYKKLEKYL